MASRAQITITVTSTRGASKIAYSTKGKYVSFITSGYQRLLQDQPIQSTASLEAFWTPILAKVQADITANP